MFGPDLSDYAGMVVSTRSDDGKRRETSYKASDADGVIVIGIAVATYWLGWMLLLIVPILLCVAMYRTRGRIANEVMGLQHVPNIGVVCIVIATLIIVCL